MASIGFEIVGCIGLGTYLGYRLDLWLADVWLDTDPIFMIIGFAAGVTAAGKALWRVVKQETRETETGDENGDGS